MQSWKKLLLGLAALAIGFAVACAGAFGPCWSAWWSYGVLEWRCPTGVMPYLEAETSALGRGVKGTVRVSAVGQLYDEQLNAVGTSSIRRFSPRALLVHPDGKEEALDPERRWRSPYAGSKYTEFFLPKDAPDGDYVLRVTARVPSGEAQVDVPLPLYRPALSHLLTDAPVYRAGQTVKARAVLVDAGSFAPLDDRPGHWKVWDPAGELVMEEKGRTAAFGTTSTTLPLAADAPAGQWSLAFESGAVTTRHSFEVREYRLPRFLVTLTPTQTWYPEGAVAVVEGTARYTSGAPVIEGPVSVVARASGAWPAPTDWLEPRQLRTDREGKFRVELGMVPTDLVGKATINLFATVTDETGEAGQGAASVLLSEEPVAVEAVTELAGGLVPDANNRLYLRVATPDGKPLPGVKVRLRREWDARDPGIEAETDADAVAKFQFDPGQPVTVTEPSLPVRPAATEAPVRVDSVVDATGGGADLALAELGDTLTTLWRPCANLVVGQANATVWLRAGPGGTEELWARELNPVAVGCLRDRARGARLRGNASRAVTLALTLNNPGVATVDPSVSVFAGNDEGVADAFAEAAIAARGCVAGLAAGGDLPVGWTFTIAEGARSPRLGRVAASGSSDLAAHLACIERALAGAQTRSPVTAAVGGLLEASVTGETQRGTSWSSPASWPGFSFVATVEIPAADQSDAEPDLGDAVLRLPVGAVPPLRLRLSEVVVNPGAEIELTAVRGPDFYGELPEKLRLVQGDRLLVAFDFDPKKRVGKFVVPGDATGFASVDWGGARAVIYVRPQAQLSVALSSPAPWKPGEEATLEVRTATPGGPTAAGVSLVGVDSAMAAIAPLPAPDDWARVTVLATSEQPAFGVLDAKALQTGQVSGDNAAQATVLRISGLPPSQPGSDSVNARNQGIPDVDTPLSEAFYGLYAEARKAVRAWEKSAPEGELMTAERMVRLWESTLAQHPARDPFGRPLHLSALPHDLLALANPRVMVSDAARLPEDVENWPVYVAEEAP